MTTATTADVKATDLRIQRALAKPGATGMKGFLLWTEAAWPQAISQKILQAAAKYTPGAGTQASTGNLAFFGRVGARRRRFGALGDDSGLVDVSFDAGSIGVSSDVTQALSDATQAPVSQTTDATPSAPASSSWASDIGNAITAATTAYLGVQQVKDAQTIFNTNLQRAQQGKSMIATNPTSYGLSAPTANIGLTSSTQNTVLIVGGVLAAGLVLASLAGGRRKST